MVDVNFDLSFIGFWSFWFWLTLVCLNFSIVRSKRLDFLTCCVVSAGSFLVAHTCFLFSYSIYFLAFTPMRSTWNIYLQFIGAICFVWWLRREYPVAFRKFVSIFVWLMPMQTAILLLAGPYYETYTICNIVLNYPFRMLWFICLVKTALALPMLMLRPLETVKSKE